MFKGCGVVVEGMVLKANLIPLEMSDFDIILSMDWFSNHKVSMNYLPRTYNLRNLDTQNWNLLVKEEFYPIV